MAHFRSLAYYEHDANAKRFRPPAELTDVFQKWSIYETCEFVHYTLEVAFDAILQHLPDADIVDTNEPVSGIFYNSRRLARAS